MDVEIFARALQPVSATSPCGGPLEPGQLRALRALERHAWAEQLADRRPRLAAVGSKWTELAARSETVLTRQCKHVEVAVQLVRSVSFLNGFDGTKHGVVFLADLATTYWNDSYCVQGEDANGALWDFLTPGSELPNATVAPDLFQIWSSLPLTASAGDADPMSFRTVQEHQARQDLRPWDDAARMSPRDFYQAVHAHLEGASNAYARLGALLQTKAKATPGGMDRERDDFAKAQALVRTYLDLIDRAIAVAAPAPEPTEHAERECIEVPILNPSPDDQGAFQSLHLGHETLRTSLDAARYDWPNGLRQVAEHAAGERTGRELFLLKLDIARLFIEKRRHDLAGVLLDGLNAETTERGLLQWEGRAFVAEMKALLRQCRIREGKQEEALKLQEELCHLAPWLAADA